jgi:hypothetical protein
MLLTLIAAGGIPLASTDVEPGTGTVDVPADAIVRITPESSGVVGTGLPLGSFLWQRPFDPSQRSPYAFDWTAMLGTGETIADIRRITINSDGADLGVMVDDGSDDALRLPTIDAENKMVGLWFVVSPSDQEDEVFAGSGKLVGVSMLIRTDAVPYREYEATAVLTVRQR